MEESTLRSALKIEQHGVDAIPQAERTKSWWDLFVVVAGVNIALSTMLAGGVLVPHLSWPVLCLALVVGNAVLGILVSLMGYMGVDFGIPASVASRCAFGYPRGTWLSSSCILISLIGWFAVNAEIGGLAVDGVLETVFGFSSPTLLIVLIGISNAIVAIIGFECIKWLSRLSVPLLLALAVWLLVVIASRYDIPNLVRYQPSGEISFSTAVDLTIGGLVVGAFVASDVSRYVRSRKDNWMGAMLGIVPATFFLMILGALASLATGDGNPVNAVRTMGLGIPALAVIVLATWTTNDINIYCGGLALTNMFPRLGRWQNTLIVSVLGTFLAALRITDYYTSFLQMLAYMFSPLIGVVMSDFFLIQRTRLDLPEMYRNDGRFHYTGGINPIAWSVVGMGIVIGFFTPSYLVASLVSIACSGVMYYVLMRMFYLHREM